MNVFRAYAALIEDVSAQERMVTARINTAGIDRYRTVIEPQGGDLSKYNKVVLWEHGNDPTRGKLPIGKNNWIRQTANAITARTQFAKDKYSQALFELYQDGTLNAWSVNVLPQAGSYGPPTQAEMRARPELEACETIYRKWELAEYSAVAVPGNADALTILEQRGIWFPPEAQTVEPVTVAQSAPEDDADEPESLPRYIKKEDGKYCVYSEDGKKLGEHDSREGAEKQLAAIEAHKHDKGRSLLSLRRELADDFTYMETRLMTHLRDMGELLKGRV